jgi:hypothetical protein
VGLGQVSTVSAAAGTALADGFVSVGSHNGRPAAWVTSDGTTRRDHFPIRPG